MTKQQFAKRCKEEIKEIEKSFYKKSIIYDWMNICDAREHIKLYKSWILNRKKSPWDLDTASRDYIPNDLYDYMMEAIGD